MFSLTVSDNSAEKHRRHRVSGIIMSADFWGAIGANAFALHPEKSSTGTSYSEKNSLANLPTVVL